MCQKLEWDVLLTQRDRGALHPGARLEADQPIIRHLLLLSVFKIRSQAGLSEAQSASPWRAVGGGLRLANPPYGPIGYRFTPAATPMRN
jgi:hypothetical protein